MGKQKLKNLFRLRLYDLTDAIQHCLENNFTGIINNLGEEKPYAEYDIVEMPDVWDKLLTLKPHDKYSK